MIDVETVRGLVRPVISILLTLTVVYLAVVGKVEPKELLTIFAIVIGFYFGERAAGKKFIQP